jgi:Flp pilus assembly protein TadG
MRGQSLVEFALVIPVFLVILFGILDFGFLLYSRITLSSGTREGAHAAVTQIDNPLGIPAIVRSTVQANATGLTWADVVVTPTCIAASGHPACDFGTGGNADPQSGDSVQVTSTYVYHSFFARFFGATVSVDATATMVIE